jgi:hypothetical protein
MKILPAMEMKMSRPKSMRKLGHGKVTTADVAVSKAAGDGRVDVGGLHGHDLAAVGEDGVRVPVLGAEAGDGRLDERLWLLQVQLLSFGETGRCNCGSAYADHM